MLASSAPKNRTIVRSRNAVRLTRAALQTAFVVSEDLGTTLAERLFTTPRRHARPDRERAVLADAREGIVDVQLRAPHSHGATCSVPTWRWGYGPVVLLVHGWEGRGSQLGAFVEPLVAAGFSVVTFDAPGHGNSPDRRLYLTDLADCIVDVAAAVGPVHAIIGHSFGAAGVLLAGARNGLSVPRTIAIAPNVIIEDAVRRFADVVGLDTGDRTALEQRLAASSGLSVEDLSVERLVAGREGGMLVVHDRDDREVSFRHGEALVSAWRGAELVTTTGLGHRRILRDPGVLARVVDFVADGVREPASDLVREVDRHLRD
jgi:pimeloyl-ACP methyl ester carboxylesterase